MFKEFDQKGEKWFSTEIVALANYHTVTRSYRIWLKNWLARYVAKAKNLPFLLRVVFQSVVSDLPENSLLKPAVQKLFIKPLGKWDIGIEKLMNEILSKNSPIKFLTVSLDNNYQY